MRVTVIAATQSPMDVIGIAAGMCYGKPEPSPKRVRRCAEARFRAQASDAMWSYRAAIDEGAKFEDARYLLPEATKTSLVMTINARSLQNFLTLRLDSHAQWEIRSLAAEVEWVLMDHNKQWYQLMELLQEVRNGHC